MYFVFDRTAEGRAIKNLTVVDDATHEAVAIVPERAIGGLLLTQILDHQAVHRGLPNAIRTMARNSLGGPWWRGLIYVALPCF